MSPVLAAALALAAGAVFLATTRVRALGRGGSWGLVAYSEMEPQALPEGEE